MKNKDRELTVKDAASFVGVTNRTIINYIKSKEIEAIKVGKNWFIKEPSLHAFAKRYGFSEALAEDKNDDIDDVEDALIEISEIEKVPIIIKNKHVLLSLRLYQIAREAFLMTEWKKIEAQDLTRWEERLSILKFESLEFIGAGYYSFDLKEKIKLYKKSREKIGGIVGIIGSHIEIEKKWANELHFIEGDLLSAYSSSSLLLPQRTSEHLRAITR